MAEWTTYPFKSSDKGTVFGAARRSATRKDSALERNEVCREMSGNSRAWTGAITYTPAGQTKMQTQACAIA